MWVVGRRLGSLQSHSTVCPPPVLAANGHVSVCCLLLRQARGEPRVQECVGCSEPAVWLVPHQSHDEPLPLRAQPAQVPAQVLVDPAARILPYHQLHVAAALEGDAAAQREVEGGARAENVDLRAVPLAPQDLGCHVP
eukprot:CAMPEP_0179219754 /NCGR_PEP_ID=MMETSP0797-20121207/5213_1 /TAXON_ID=47934 /ORGANISM="Dinophysis acuminata, Strain DAEP01" /LENGTH=137 /DNA_ID=CAMNT_0020926265 /DNA_START=451 /DNA_END=861 /DNA_ORIENTATION=-